MQRTPCPVGQPPRIALIHALAHSVAPINAAFARDWKQARLMNLLDDSLSMDLAATQGLDASMTQRFQSLASYAIATGADAILFTCSAFGPCIEAVARTHPSVPIFPPNSAMIEEIMGCDSAVRDDEKIGLIATFQPTLQSMPPEFPHPSRLVLAWADGALAALNAGDLARHDQLIAQTALQLRDQGCTRIALSQFSMARARELCEKSTGLTVYSTVDSAVAALRRRLLGAERR
jgi:hypothetical protein